MRMLGAGARSLRRRRPSAGDPAGALRPVSGFRCYADLWLPKVCRFPRTGGIRRWRRSVNEEGCKQNPPTKSAHPSPTDPTTQIAPKAAALARLAPTLVSSTRLVYMLLKWEGSASELEGQGPARNGRRLPQNAARLGGSCEWWR